MLWVGFLEKCSESVLQISNFHLTLFLFYINEFHLIESDVTDDTCSFWIWTSDPLEGIFLVMLSKMIPIKSVVQLEFDSLYQLYCHAT